jgi:Flp pilus assembly protein TadG
MFARFIKSRRGAVAMATGLVILPLLIVAGAPIDLARQIELRSALQNNVDAAAMAGASVLGDSTASTDAPALVKNYLAASDAGMAATVTVVPPMIVANSAVTVNVTATLPASFMAFMKMNLPVGVMAVAGGPGEPQACTTPLASNAWDLNQLWMYAVDSDGTKDTTNLVELVDNNGTTYKAGTKYCQNEPLKIGERLAFELVNETGGRQVGTYNSSTNSNGQNANTYGAVVGTMNDFYTSDYPTTKNSDAAGTAYDAANQAALVNASQVSFSNVGAMTVATSTKATKTVTAPTSCYVTPGGVATAVTYNSSTGYGTLGAGVTAQQENVVVYNSAQGDVGCGNNIVDSDFNLDATCLELNGGILTVDWNDMGGQGDSDLYGLVNKTQYTDMSYTYSCTGSAGSAATNYSKVILTQ